MDITVNADNNVINENNFTLPGNVSIEAGFLYRLSENNHQYIISLILSSVYTIFLFPIGFIGNILILLVNYAHSGHLSSPDLYFVNLAVADLALVADSLIEVFNLKKGYYDKAALCTFMNLFQQANMYSSVFFLTWMSLDRYVTLTGSMGRRMPCPRLSCFLIWAFSLVLTVLPFAVAQLQHAGELHFCFANVTQIQWLEVMFGFLLPFCVLGVCYWKIAKALQRSQENTTLHRPRRQKAQRMISAAVVVFFICWLPENVFVSVHLVKTDNSESTLWQVYPLTGHAVRLAAFSNSCLNPLIYSFLGETFQDKLRLLLYQKTTWAKLHRSASGRSVYGPATSMCRCPSSKNVHLCSKSLSRTIIYSSQEQLNTIPQQVTSLEQNNVMLN